MYNISNEYVLFFGIIGLIPIFLLGCKIFDYIFRKEYGIPFPSDGKLFFLLFIVLLAYILICVYESVYM